MLQAPWTGPVGVTRRRCIPYMIPVGRFGAFSILLFLLGFEKNTTFRIQEQRPFTDHALDKPLFLLVLRLLSHNERCCPPSPDSLSQDVPRALKPRLNHRKNHLPRALRPSTTRTKAVRRNSRTRHRRLERNAHRLLQVRPPPRIPLPLLLHDARRRQTRRFHSHRCSRRRL